MVKTKRNGQDKEKWSRQREMVKTKRNGQDKEKWSRQREMVKTKRNGQDKEKWSRQREMVKTKRNGQDKEKWSRQREMVKTKRNGQNKEKWSRLFQKSKKRYDTIKSYNALENEEKWARQSISVPPPGSVILTPFDSPTSLSFYGVLFPCYDQKTVVKYTYYGHVFMLKLSICRRRGKHLWREAFCAKRILFGRHKTPL